MSKKITDYVKNTKPTNTEKADVQKSLDALGSSAVYDFRTGNDARLEVSMGEVSLKTGDGVLQGLTVSIGGSDKSSTCELTLADPGLLYASKLIQDSITSGGLVNPEWVQQSTQQGLTGGDSSGGTGGGSSFTPSQFKKGDTMTWRDCEILVMREGLKRNFTKAQIAYVLGTAAGEVGGYFPDKVMVGKLFVERISRADGANYANTPGIGNEGSAENGYNFRGRGLIQITGKGLYRDNSKFLGKDILNNPELLEEPGFAIWSAFEMLEKKTPTAKPNIHSDRWGLKGNNPDFYNSRKMVNGIVAKQMPKYMAFWNHYWKGTSAASVNGIKCSLFEELQKAAGTTSTSTPNSPATTPTNTSKKPNLVESLIPKKPEPSMSVDTGSKGVENTQSTTQLKGSPIKIKLQMGSITTNYEYMHVGTSTSLAPDTTTISGGSIKWNMHRTTNNNRYEKLSLKQFCELITAQYGKGIKWLVPGDGGTLPHVVQTGASDLETLTRECRIRGIRIIDNPQIPNVLIFTSVRANYTDILIQPNQIINASWSDEAISEPHPVVQLTSRNPRMYELENAEVVVEKSHPDFLKPLLGDNEKALKRSTGAVGVKNDSNVDVGSIQASKAPVTTSGVVSELDAKLAGEERRLTLGYSGTITLTLAPEFLTIQPGDVVSLALPAPFDYDWYVSDISHTISVNSMKTVIKVGKPVDVPVTSTPSADGSTPANSNTPGTAPESTGKWVVPMKSPTAYSGIGQRWGRLHAGNDTQSASGSREVYSMRDGIVIRAEYMNGYGNLVEVTHTIGGEAYFSRYAHLASMTVKKGDKVNGGQQVGVMGGTGKNPPYPAHLHWEIRRGTEGYKETGLLDPMKTPSIRSMFQVTGQGSRQNQFPAVPE